jgi:predicted transcriptional regulator
MPDEKRVKDIMEPIEAYETIGVDKRLCDALAIVKRKHDAMEAGEEGPFHKTVFVTDSEGRIIGKVSVYDVIRGLVPETMKDTDSSRAYYAVLSSRAREVAEEVGEVQERFKWLGTSFFELVKQEVGKDLKDVMSPIHPLLEEDDGINKAVYIMFKEDVRQPLVVRGKEIVGVVNFMGIFEELLSIAGPSCNVPV